MAIQLEANYSKKLGLPGYSSHQFSVTIRVELADIKQVEAESTRLYSLLQGCVDRDIKETGFLPVHGSSNGNGGQHNGSNGHHASNGNGTGNGHPRTNGQSEAWSCSDKQKALILKIVEDHRLDKQDIEALSQERFGKGVRQLNRMEASGLIEELLETHGGNQGNGRSNGNRFQNPQKARTA
jgi:hypothetical protein